MFLMKEFFLNRKTDGFVLGGPTSSGKSALGLKLATEYQLGSIINGDSIQRYKGLPILSACPSQEDYKIHFHEGYEIHCPFLNTRYSGAQWVQETKNFILKSLHFGKTPIVVGGTGLYLQGLCFSDFCAVPDIDPILKEKLENEFAVLSLEEKKNIIVSFDPEFVQRFQDPQRLQRAFVVYKGTGKTLSYWQEQHRKQYIKKKERQWSLSYCPLVLWPPKNVLHDRTLKRWKDMIDRDVCQEVQNFIFKGLQYLMKKYYGTNDDLLLSSNLLLNAPRNWTKVLKLWDFFSLSSSSQVFSFDETDLDELLFIFSKNPLFSTLGFKEIVGFILDIVTLKHCEQQYIIKTHQYIKRQRTWYRSRWNPYVALCIFDSEL